MAASAPARATIDNHPQPRPPATHIAALQRAFAAAMALHDHLQTITPAALATALAAD